MFIEISMVLALLAVLVLGWWFLQWSAADARRRAVEHREIGRHDHARVFEMAKLESEASRWRGWF